MARGFDSKSVSDQQEEKERAGDVRREGPLASPRRRSLELARVDLLRRWQAAPEAHKPALKAALDELDEMIRRA